MARWQPAGSSRDPGPVQAPGEPAERAASGGRWRRTLAAIFLAVSCLFLFRGLSTSPPDPTGPPPTTMAAATSQPEYVTSNIEDLRVGDTVLAFNPDTSQAEPRRIVDAFDRTTYRLRVLEIHSRDGTSQTIRTTDEHPFWVVDQQDFKPAGELEVGQELLGPRGEVQTLATTWAEEHPEGVTVYNFEVEGAHTYFVCAGDLSETPVLVHNAMGGECFRKLGKALKGIKLASEHFPQIRPGTKAWKQAVKQLSGLGKGKLNLRVRTATEAKQLLQEARGNMNRFKQYTRDGRGPHRNYPKGYEVHNNLNSREKSVGNDLRHIKWNDGESSGHIYYDTPN